MHNQLVRLYWHETQWLNSTEYIRKQAQTTTDVWINPNDPNDLIAWLCVEVLLHGD